ncbi:MAG: hypothetical protein R3C49_21620 [Planctomycetaceae bacterium]
MVRSPMNEELEILTEFLKTGRLQVADSGEAAQQLITVGNSQPPADIDPQELAAWTSVCRLVLNLAETNTRN